MTKRKAKEDGYNTAIPELVAQFREIRDRLLNHPAILRPWPSWVPAPEHLDCEFDHLEKAERELNRDIPDIQRLNRSRRELKTSMARLLRYVEQALTGSSRLQPPGFDLSRNPGGAADGPAYGSGLATAAPHPQQQQPEERRKWETTEKPRRHLVRAVRPVFRAACIEVEAEDQEDAIGRALSLAPQIPEDQWTGRNDPEHYYFDVHCVHTGQTPEGHPFSLLDFPRYTVISTNPFPPVPAYAVLDPWVDQAGPILAASLLSNWIDQMVGTQGDIYEDAIDQFQEIAREWKGSDDEKVLPLKDPGERRFLLEMTEQVLKGINLLKEPD